MADEFRRRYLVPLELRTCEKCGFVAKRVDILTLHMKRHQKKRKYECHICDEYAFVRKIDLLYHIKRKHLEKLNSLSSDGLTTRRKDKDKKEDKKESANKSLTLSKKNITIESTTLLEDLKLDDFDLEEFIKTL